MESFTRKECEDIAMDMIENEITLLEQTTNDIVSLERIQDSLLGGDEDLPNYDMEKEERKAAHKDVSNVIRAVYNAHSNAEQQVIGKIFKIIECEQK